MSLFTLGMLNLAFSIFSWVLTAGICFTVFSILICFPCSAGRWIGVRRERTSCIERCLLLLLPPVLLLFRISMLCWRDELGSIRNWHGPDDICGRTARGGMDERARGK